MAELTHFKVGDIVEIDADLAGSWANPDDKYEIVAISGEEVYTARIAGTNSAVFLRGEWITGGVRP